MDASGQRYISLLMSYPSVPSESGALRKRHHSKYEGLHILFPSITQFLRNPQLKNIKQINMKLFTLLLLAFLGVAAAFFRPAVPFQLESVRGGDISFDDVMDHGLDNMNVEEDKNITPARKCGFCMGVSCL